MDGSRMKKYRSYRLSLGWQILIGLALGIVLGAVFYQNKLAITAMQNIGNMFIGLIQMIVLPIVVSCLTVGIANMGDIKQLGRVGGKTIIYFEIMTTIAIALGLLIGNISTPATLSTFTNYIAQILANTSPRRNLLAIQEFGPL
ncbi:Proton glutamate symport protein [Levilactobacillus brevis KB290]|uniref:Proton glutamate symport protein n=1 Tax=Levilactobacillus brevis KB290 TaxID=1001583 RepID=M5ABQ2_LEVBR|nr:Proton glutamate symport protein [Levilactobacillus brevis KB290]